MHQHVFPVLDALIAKALDELSETNTEITCEKGCNHCCYLLVEISMEEAQTLVAWLAQQPAEIRKKLIGKIQKNAKDARKLFANSEHNKAHVGAVDITSEINEDCFNEYFYGKRRPCPFNENRSCLAYDVRPSACRLHMVSSDPLLCRHDIEDSEDYEVPDRIEELRDEFAPINTAVAKDGRWGHLGILVEIALKEAELI